MRSPGVATGAIVGLIVSAPLLALGMLGHTVAGLPFAPFDLFDTMARGLPGGVVTRGIEALVDVLMALGVSLSATSKLAEQVLAVALVLILAVLCGAVLFALVRGLGRGLVAGVVLGAAGGVVAALALLFSGQAAGVHPVAAVSWVLAGGLLWGAGLGWAHDLLLPLPAAAAAEPERGAELVRRGRREVLVRLGGASAALTIAGAGLATLLRSTTRPAEPMAGLAPVLPPVDLPERPGAVMAAPGTRPEYTPVSEHYRIDINLRPPVVDGHEWRLPIVGLVDRPRVLELQDFYEARLGDPMRAFITLACISNPVGGDLIGTTRWSGLSLARLLETVGVRAEARLVAFEAADGFHESLPLDLVRDDPRIMLAYAWDGRPLTYEHGFPLRIYIPDRYGMKQPKWITRMELAAAERPGYWVERGWDAVARMRATSVIDTVAVDAMFERDGRVHVPVGGIAHAGARGISRVEVQVDGGPWRAATLRLPLSERRRPRRLERGLAGQRQTIICDIVRESRVSQIDGLEQGHGHEARLFRLLRRRQR